MLSRNLTAFPRIFFVLVLVVACVFLSPGSMILVNAAPGDLDPGFGAGGNTTTAFSAGSDFAYATAIQTNGKIVVAGTVSDSGPNGGFAVARYDGNGNLDPEFGVGGKVVTKLSRGFDTAHAVAIQPDAKIVVAGDFDIQGFALVRYDANGSLDGTFGTGGKVLTPYSISGYTAHGIAIQADGKLIVIGSTSSDFAIVRYKTDGTLDSGFGSNGRVTVDFMNTYNDGWGVAVQNDGKIVAVGSTHTGNANQDFAVARLKPNGEPDNGFGSNGKVVTTFTNFDDNAYSVAIQPDGKVVVGGGIYSFYAFVLARYNTDGSLDTGFGENGKVITTAPNRNLYGFAIALQQNGKVIIAGYAITGSFETDFAVARYNVNGSLDSSFGNAGLVITDFGSTADIAWDVAVQADGKIVVAGFVYNDTTGYDFAVARYHGDGPSFDVCIQDDASGDFLQLSPTTGDYQFTDCSSMVLGGTGIVAQRGGTITLQHNIAGRRVLARIDLGSGRATASIQLISQGTTLTIMDRNIANNTCACAQ